MIPAIDQGLEELLRAAVPLPPELADISFDTPDGTWGAQLSRITVSLFLFDVARSSLPPQPPASRTRDDGRVESRPALPLIRLSYLVSAWAGNTVDEHQVLGDVLTGLLKHDAIPPAYLTTELPGSAKLRIGAGDMHKPGELWGALQGKLKPSFELEVTVPFGADWSLAAPLVTSVEGEVSARPDDHAGLRSTRSTYSTRTAVDGQAPRIVQRRAGSAVVAEGRQSDPA